MKRLVWGTVALVLVTVVSSVVEAQDQPRQQRGARMGRGGMRLTGLLEQKSVQEELKLTEDQLKAVKALAAKSAEGGQGLADLKPDERAAKIAERIQEQETALAAAIGVDQLKRLKQISLQVRGVMAFSDPTVVKELSLTDEQKEKLKAIRDESFQSRERFDPEKVEESRAKIAAARKAAVDKALAVLTPEQTTKWNELIGTPFTGEIRREFPGGGRRRGGNRPPGTPPQDQA